MAQSQFVVKAKENSVSGGAPLITGITVTKGELLTISVAADDKWSAGAADRESNAPKARGSHPKRCRRAVDSSRSSR